MARRATGAPGIGSGLVAAAVAFWGSERKAAAALGVARSTLNGILRGVHDAGAATTAAITTAPNGPTLRSAARLFEGDKGVQKARNVARQERREPGALQRQLDAVESAVTSQPTASDIREILTPELAQQISDERWPGESIEDAIRRIAGDDVWDAFEEEWAQGMTRDEWYEIALNHEREQAEEAGIEGLGLGLES